MTAPTTEFEESPYYGRHHARFHEEGIVYHVLSRTFQGTGILRPSPETNACIAGVIARGLKLNSSIRIYGHAFMSNHFHLMLRGSPSEIPAFVGYLKKEISRRLGSTNNWPDTMWGQPYYSTALVTHDDQVHCLKYILSQGVKEGLVARPEQWPGLHSAKSGCGIAAVKGWWLDGTRLAKTRYREQHKSRESRSRIDAKAFRVDCSWRETKLPGWQSLDAKAYAKRIRALCDDVVKEGAKARKGKPPLGVRKVLGASMRKRWGLPKLPFYETRKKMICWSQNRCAQLLQYLMRYWCFQRAFRQAADALSSGDANASFPPSAFIPGRLAAP